MARSILLTLAFLVLLAACAFGLLMLLVSAKEGADTWQLVVGWMVALSLLLIWWQLGKFFVTGYQKFLSTSGLVVLILTGFIYTTIALPYIINYVRGPRLAKKVRIENFQESLVTWPGFDGPVGMKIEFDLDHPRINANVLTPSVWMGPFKKLQLDNIYFFDKYYLYGGVYPGRERKTMLLLRTGLYSKLDRPRGRLNDASPTALVYHLYPQTLAFLESSTKLCLRTDSYGLQSGSNLTPVFNDGEEMSAAWFIAGEANLVVDLSDLLTQTLRAQSSLQNNAEAWRKIHERWEPQGLLAAGYRECNIQEGDLDRKTGRQCYCRESPINP